MQRFFYPILLGLFFMGNLIPRSLWSQEYLIQTQRFSVEEGLSNRFVYSAVQDDLGFMWFGTKHGLNRYDGYQFKILTAEKDGLQSNVTVGLRKDSEGMIWVTYANTNDQLTAVKKVDILNPWTLEVKSFDETFGVDCPLKEKDIKRIEEHKKERLIITTKKGKAFSYSQEEGFQNIYTTDSTTIISKLLYSSNGYWIHSNDQLLYLDTKTNQLDTIIYDSLYTFDQFKNKLILQRQRPLNRDNPYAFHAYPLEKSFPDELENVEGTVLEYFEEWWTIKGLEFILTKRNFIVTNSTGQKIFEYKPIYNYLRDAYVDNQYNIWLCSDGEIVKVHCLS
ncbi:MAG: hypothetical protein GY810_11520 [Aureispira sp.]|nr:hypothetical protein [Aureispira sp.]